MKTISYAISKKLEQHRQEITEKPLLLIISENCFDELVEPMLGGTKPYYRVGKFEGIDIIGYTGIMDRGVLISNAPFAKDLFIRMVTGKINIDISNYFAIINAF